MDYSKTQRILLLVDLNPLLQNPNSSSYLNSILTASKLLLSFTPLSSSLFAFKLFFSSLSPLRSSSALHSLSNSVSFDHPSQTLTSLSETLNSISSSSFSTLKEASLPSKSSYTVSSLLQLLHDYAWESQIDNLPGTPDNLPVIPSNLVVLFSPICRSLKCLAEYFNMDLNDECLRNSDGLCSQFRKHFGIVNDRFVSRDIHTGWIDVNNEKESSGEKDEIDESLLQLGWVENGIRSLGWSFCSTDSTILGSSLVPFGLIYPQIGVPSILNNNDIHKKIRGQLSLEISDVSGKPLECKCCDLELLNMKFRTVDIMDNLEFGNSCGNGFDQTFWDQFGDGIVMLHVKTAQRYAEVQKIAYQPCNQILVQVAPEGFGKSRQKSFDDFFAYRVLEQLSIGSGNFVRGSFVPIWHILLSFLYREGCWASVSISKNNGDSCKGFLKPFTAHLALLSIIDDEHIVPDKVGVTIEDNVNELPSKLGIHISNSKRYIDYKVGSSLSGVCVPVVDGKRKKIKKHLLQDLSWNTFYDAAFGCFDLDLADVYFSRDGVKSKKLKFLKCWMRQIKKSSCDHHKMPDKSKLNQRVAKEMDERLIESRNDSEEPSSRLSLSDPSEAQGIASVSCSETADAFFSNLPKKIQHGLEAEGVDLQILAQRLVHSSIYWLHQKQEQGNILESQTPETAIPSDRTLGAEVIDLLTREPKELKKWNDNNATSQESKQGSNSESIVREYEWQILLRMEILQSDVAGTMEELTKRKLVKQICSLLEIIQYLVEGGIHGHMSLYDYAERTIKTRYSRNLGDVVQMIYAQMDLLPFGDEDESPLLLLNSEDSNQSCRDKQDMHDMADSKDNHKFASAEVESSQPLEISEESPQGIRIDEHAQKISEARKRRERARRFVSFTSWVPDLQRVWAPKQPKAGTVKSQPLSKELKRKDKQRANYTVVCETPLTGQKPTYCRGNSEDDEEFNVRGSSTPSCVSKALFQDAK